MHLYLYVRGKFEQVEVWKSHAQAAYWKFRRIDNKTGEEEIILVQGALRPTVFGAYEYIFPREALAEVCSFFGITNRGIPAFSLNSKIGQIKGKMQMSFIRKIFGCKNIPLKILKKAKEIPSTFSTAEFERGCSNCNIPGVALHVIGIKEDTYQSFPEFGYTQEGL